jgi:transcriptional regulator with XRE-family HTH domain
MERKSIGSFIAVLRKANGFTQRQLADKLGVSDKAVSRWELDETAPDLYLIPIIAEIFGVTSDELLRGERMGEAPAAEKQNQKTERHIKAVLKNVRSKFLTRTLICALIAIIGLFAAMICNFGFYRCELGFYLAFLFYASAIIIQIIFAVTALTGLDTEEFEGTIIAETKKYIIKKTESIIFLSFILFAYTLPLLIEASQTSGVIAVVDFSNWLVFGIIFAAVAGVFCFFASIIVDRIAKSKGIYICQPKFNAKQIREAFCAPLPKLAKVFLPVIAVTIILNILCSNIFNYEFFLKDKGRHWDNANDFIAYMETPLDRTGFQYSAGGTVFDTYSIYIDGEVLEFKWKNRYILDYSVNGIFCRGSGTEIHIDITGTPIYPDVEKEYPDETANYNYNLENFHAVTYSWQDTSRAHKFTDCISIAFALTYIAEAGVFAVIYINKIKSKLKTTV